MKKKCFSLIISLFIFLAPKAILANDKLLFELKTHLNSSPIICLENTTNQTIVIPDNLRGLPFLQLVITSEGKVLQDKRWLNSKDVYGDYGSGQIFQITPREKQLIGFQFDTNSIELSENGKFYMLVIIRDVPNSKIGIRVSNVVSFEVRNKRILTSKMVERAKMPKDVLFSMDNEINKIRSEPPIAHP